MSEVEFGTWGAGYGNRRHLVNPERIVVNDLGKVSGPAMCSSTGNPVWLDYLDHDVQIATRNWSADVHRMRVRARRPCAKCSKWLPDPRA
jgi:hypothetical protein